MRKSKRGAGMAQRVERSVLAGVSVVRHSLWPHGGREGGPQSFAVARKIAWSPAGAQALPRGYRPRRPAESRWELDFDLPGGARCLGLGENLSGLNLRGRSWTHFATDDPLHIENIEAMYKSIPFLVISERGKCRGIFVDSPARQRWDLDTKRDHRGLVELLSRRGMQIYFFGPASLPELLSAYTELTGRSHLPPLWSLGHQQSRWSYPTEKRVFEIAREFRKRKIPCDTIVLDIDYMEGFRVFTASKKGFPKFKRTMAKLAKKDFNVVTIVDPGVKEDRKYSAFQSGMKEGHFCKDARGKVFIDKVWPGRAAFPDFLRKETREWWGKLHEFYVKNGVAGIWNDMNEPAMFDHMRPLPKGARELPPDSKQLFMQRAPEGATGHFEVRNVYGMMMSRATHEGLLKLRPNERPFVLSRSAYAGAQRYAAVWLGDNMSFYEHLAKSLPMLVNMGLSGVPFCGVDIGGFAGECAPELLARWYAAGIFYPFFRNHNSHRECSQEPWVFGPETEAQCRRLIEARYRLLPYLQGLFWEHRRTGAPILRPLLWHFPDDEVAADIDDQFFFGSDVLVAPIVQRGRDTRPVYFPRGLWHPWEGGPPIRGGGWRTVRFALGQVPAFVRDGAILPLADVVQSTAGLPKAPITFACFGKAARGVYFEDDGISLAAESGSYNEWELRFAKGKFTAKLRHGGYRAPARRYSWGVGKKSRPFTLPRISVIGR